MTLYRYRAVANGLRTTHPIPDLPFVDDAHIPVEDPDKIEAVGRHPSTDMWGREDPVREGGWAAFTTDPIRHDLAWCVRWHPDHGRSVVLYRDSDAASVHVTWDSAALLFRSGGYWWDGTTWYRPSQVWDAAGEDHVRRPVPAAMTVTAADLLADGAGDPKRGQVLRVGGLDVDAPPRGRWLDDLALWAARRAERAEQGQETGQLPLSGCVVSITAPELTGDQLLGVTEMAEIAGVAASTLRAYLSRDEGNIPLPQATVQGRSMWARPVVEEWAEQRGRSPESITSAVSAPPADGQAGASMPVGVAAVWSKFTRVFVSELWERPDRRRRWALRWRTEPAVRQLAEELAWDVAANTTRLVPTEALAVTIRHAFLDEFATGQARERDLDDGTHDAMGFYGIAPGITKMLDWLIRHHPTSAAHTIGEIVGVAERRLGVAREVSEETLRRALGLDGDLDQDACRQFLDRVLPPA